MTGTLFIGDYAHSSWSLRAWLPFDRAGIPVTVRVVDFSTAEVAAQMAPHRPARTVPAWQTPEGAMVWDSLSIAEELATRHPDAGLWPTDPAARATARSLAAEMHSGFAPLRANCPMHLRVAYEPVPQPDAVMADLARIADLWSFALDRFGGPWLCGGWSIADAAFAPVATRIATYGLPMPDDAMAYVATTLADPSFRRWRALGLVTGATLPWYERDFPRRPWPGPAPIPAEAVSDGTSENAACPYSGGAPTHLMRMDGRIFGFCTATCRDKTVADPAAWPAFMTLVQS